MICMYLRKAPRPVCHPFVYVSRRERERERKNALRIQKSRAWRASTCSTHTFTCSHIYWFCCVFSLQVRYLFISHTIWCLVCDVVIVLVDAQTQSSPCHQFHIPSRSHKMQCEVQDRMSRTWKTQKGGISPLYTQPTFTAVCGVHLISCRMVC